VLDPRKPPTGANLNLTTLRLLVEPYPQVIAGTPQSWGFDSTSRTFTFRYSTALAAGGSRFAPGSVTEVAVPRFVYPQGYAPHLDGGAIVSAPHAGVLQILGCPGASTVAVAVSPSGRSHASCRATLRVTISPSSASLNRATSFQIRVLATLGAYRQAIAGALVYFGQRIARTDHEGRATIRVTLHRHIRRYGAIARAAGFAAGEGFISVR
jgi:hypothetical protein